MIVLSLDTTTPAGSAALVRDGVVLRESPGNPALTHGERLPADLIRVFERLDVPIHAVDLLAVAAGPGSFTGLRVGIAAMQGLAMALERRIVPVSSLEALARTGARGDAHVAAWMDAHRGEVFAALYDPSGTIAVIAPTALSPEATLQEWSEVLPPGRIRFIGDGAIRYADAIRRELGRDVDLVQNTPALAGVIGAIACEAPQRAVAPHAVVPIYIRKPDAELARARRSSAKAGSS